MREGLFIKKNKERWEAIKNATEADADQLARNFVQLVDDLSYAKTYYPGSRVTQYLNSIASSIYLGIYQNRKERKGLFVNFWKYEVPATVYKHRRIIVFSFLSFVLFYLIGFFSAHQDPGFVRQVLGNEYVEMTERNIAAGNPFGVYQSGSPLFNWIGITLNNVIVAFMYFVKGILFGVFSVMSMLKESMRIGSFHEMFFSRGYGFAFVLAVMIHGMLELPAIVFASAAGVIMGTSYLFPGTSTRLHAFRTGVKDGAKIVIGIVPILIMAGFFEGFVTRHYKMPVFLNASLLFVLLLFMCWYFIYYPAALQKRRTDAN